VIWMTVVNEVWKIIAATLNSQGCNTKHIGHCDERGGKIC